MNSRPYKTSKSLKLEKYAATLCTSVQSTQLTRLRLISRLHKRIKLPVAMVTDINFNKMIKSNNF